MKPTLAVPRSLFYLVLLATLNTILVPLTSAGDVSTSGAAAAPGASAMKLQTDAFPPGADIPAKYTCSGADVSPALQWTDAPAGTQSFALIMDDPDAPVGTFTHWVLYNLPGKESRLEEGVAKSERLPNGAAQGVNGFRRLGYGGPCPPPGKAHRYFFKLYALDANLNLKPGASKEEVERAIKGHVLGQAEVVGVFKR